MPIDDISDLLGRTNDHSNPLFDYVTTFVPRRLKTFFQYCEFLYYNSPQIFSALNKFAMYPVTEFKFTVENPKLKDKYTKLFTEQLKVKAVLTRVGIDRHLYGNAFLSMYFPFRRLLVCNHCGKVINIRNADYDFSVKNKQPVFTLKCDGCHQKGPAKVDDVKVRLANGVKIIRWDPKYIDIDHNPITGESEYYYRIPGELQDRIKAGDHFLVATMPMAFLETVAQEKIFRFARNKIYHLKADAPAGIDTRWGLPPIISTIKSFFHAAILRKANEAISLDYVVPFRVMHPQQSVASADPTLSISLSNWVNETKLNMKSWRRDPLHMMFSPIPVEVTHVGGQGRALLVTGELVESENNIIAGLGVPREFLYGGLSATGAGVTLRMLENQLFNYTSDLTECSQWLADQSATYLGWRKVKVEMEPFKLIDDVQQKSMALQTNAAAGGSILSQTTTAQILGYNLRSERELRKQDALEEQRFNYELQQEMAKQDSSLSAKAQGASQAGASQTYNQQEVIASADAIVEQLSTLDPGGRKSMLHSLEVEDYVMYSVVVQRWEAFQTQQEAMMRAQMGGMGLGGMAPPAGTAASPTPPMASAGAGA